MMAKNAMMRQSTKRYLPLDSSCNLTTDVFPLGWVFGANGSRRYFYMA